MKAANPYGKDFAAIYSDRWAFWGEKVWPFLKAKIDEKNPGAVSWLDLCCGTGSLLEPAGKAGFRCTGVDRSPHQIKHAKRNAPSVKYSIQDIRALSLPQSFDVITCMFDSLNYLRTLRDLKTVFRKSRQHLNDDGLFIFDMNTFEGLQDVWCQTSVMHDPKFTVIMESSFDAKKALGRILITGFLKEQRRYKRFQEEHIERGYTRREIENCLHSTGFTFECYDGHSFESPVPRSGRLLYVCWVKSRKRK